MRCFDTSSEVNVEGDLKVYLKASLGITEWQSLLLVEAYLQERLYQIAGDSSMFLAFVI
jgi:hypothetical protein